MANTGQHFGEYNTLDYILNFATLRMIPRYDKPVCNQRTSDDLVLERYRQHAAHDLKNCCTLLVHALSFFSQAEAIVTQKYS